MPHGCQFNNLWLDDPNFTSWIKKNEKDPHSADCKVCRSSISLKTIGRTALTFHMKSSKHQDRLKFHSSQTQETNIGFFFRPTGTSSKQMAAQTTSACSTQPTSDVTVATSGTGPASRSSFVSSQPSTSFKTSSDELKQYVSKSDTLKAEIWWCVRSAVKNHSFSSNSDISFYLKKMFPDVPAVDALSLGETKSIYLTVYGLAPHLKSIMLQDLQSGPFCILFDESLNKSSMSKQLDIHVRYWSNCSVSTRYINSFMLGHATAQDLMDNLNTLKQDQNFSNLGPNVNGCAYDKFEKQLSTDCGTGLLNIGSCGLHQIHNGYRAAVNETKWSIDHFLTSLHYVFKDVPARRQDYRNITNSSVFPLKFAAHRWVENQRVLKRAKEILPNLHQYIAAVRSKKVSDPKPQSFVTVVQFLEDKTLPAKLAFLINMCKPLMIGSAATDFLEASDLPDEKKKEFLTSAQKFLSTACHYLIKNLPLADDVIINAEVADISRRPFVSHKMVRSFVTRFPILLHPTGTMDELLMQFGQYLVEELPDGMLSDRDTGMDLLWKRISAIRDEAGRPKFQLLAEVMTNILAIPHDNASCERIHFSFVRKNRSDFRSSMSVDTLNSLLVVKQNGGVCYEREMAPDVLKRCRSATSRSLSQ